MPPAAMPPPHRAHCPDEVLGAVRGRERAARCESGSLGQVKVLGPFPRGIWLAKEDAIIRRCHKGMRYRCLDEKNAGSLQMVAACWRVVILLLAAAWIVWQDSLSLHYSLSSFTM